ncbi:break repair meiotic recombinase recruitment factor 1, partial [Dasypus novemcinctus]|uniref:break repair meiotic recombinase recruitment factor 1 n=1 Tax=Dasypus novemcinctus TaxID=9361 RepID=UPI0039C98FC9
MSKRKKLRTSGGEGVHPPKPPKNSRRGNADGAPQTSELDCLPFPKSIEGKSGPTSSAELNGEELAQAASSGKGEHVSGGERGRVEEAASLQLKRAQPPGARQCARWGWKARTGEKLPERVGSCLPLRPHSSLSPFLPGSCCIPFQNSLGKLVPQSAKPRKTVTRQAETRGEDVATRASHPEAPPEPGALHAAKPGAGRAPWARNAGDQRAGTRRRPRAERPGPLGGSPSPTVGRQPPWPPAASHRKGSPTASSTQEHLSGGGHASDSWPEAEGALAAGDGGPGGHPPSSQACGAPREGGRRRPRRPQCPVLPAQGAPDPVADVQQARRRSSRGPQRSGATALPGSLGPSRDGPEPRCGAQQASPPRPPTSQTRPPGGGCAAVELSFLPDSQIQEALDAPGLGAPTRA